MEKIRLGIIGAGSFSRTHLRGIKQLDNAEIVAICDSSEEKARERAEEFKIPYFCTDYKELLKREDIDAVTLPLPDQVHRQITIDALYAGKHVLCEKPMALNMDDCKAMVEAADKTGMQLMVGQIGRYTPSFKKAKELIDAGEIGELFFVESEYAHDYSKIPGMGGWRVTPEREPVIGGGCHAVDLLRWIAGNPTEAFAYANTKVLTDWPIFDCTIAVLKFPNNVVGKVMTSTGCKRRYTMRTVLYGTEGTIIVDNTSDTLSLFKDVFRGDEMMSGYYQKEIEMKIPVEVNNHNTMGEIGDFCQCLLENRPVTTDGREGAGTVAACLAIVESAKSGEKVEIQYI